MGFDDPGRQSSELMLRTVFSESPFRHPIIGYLDVYNKLNAMMSWSITSRAMCRTISLSSSRAMSMREKIHEQVEQASQETTHGSRSSRFMLQVNRSRLVTAMLTKNLPQN